MNLNQLYGGIDIGLKDFQFHAMDREGNPIGQSKRFPNNRPGMNQLVDYLDNLMNQRSFDSLSLGMEATGLYWFPLYHALRENEQIQQWDTKLIAMNPKIVESFRSIYPDVDKTDAVDALIIADRVRFGRGIAPQHIHSEQYLALQRLTRFYIHLTKQQTDLKNYAGSFLFLTFSEWIRCKPFSDRYGVTATKLMKKYKSADAMADLTIEELQELLVTFSHNKLGDSKQKADDLFQMAEDSFTVPAGLIDSIHLLIKQTLQQLELLEKHMNRLKKRIEKTLKGIKHPLLSIPGIGHVTAALLIAEIGDIIRFDNEAKLAKFAGLTWRKRESGNFRAEETFMTKSGNVYLRHAFLTAAQSLVNHNDEYQRYYRRKFDETPRHAHKRALSLTARKLVRLIYAMLSTNQLYMTPEERMERNQEVQPESKADESAESHLVADETSTDQVHTSSDLENQEHKKVKRTVAARSSSRQKELNGFNVPPEQDAVNT
jgi:transposase